MKKVEIMRIIVCIKQVPDSNKIKIDPESKKLIRESAGTVINPLDLYALEEGLRLRAQYGGEVVVLSMGPLQAESSLREALSYGADLAVLLSDNAFSGSDTLATSYILSEGIKKIGCFDIILTGKHAVDGDTGQVGPGLAEYLKIPNITDVRKIQGISEASIRADRLIEDGTVRIKVKLPILLTVLKEINQPRIPSLPDRIKSRKAEITIWTNKDLNLAPGRIGLNGSPTRVRRVFQPEKNSKGRIFHGNISESVQRMIFEMESSGIRLKRK
ncbi:MAG: electron transfer flavoprotein subunit beta/FixA family protein [Brevinematales bacterium]